MTGLIQDVRYGLRQLRKSPGFFSCVATLVHARRAGKVGFMVALRYE